MDRRRAAAWGLAGLLLVAALLAVGLQAPDTGPEPRTSVPQGAGEAMARVPAGPPETPPWTPTREQEAAAHAAGVPVSFRGPGGSRFVLVPPGRFLMGSPETEADRDTDEWQHEAVVRRAFYLQTTEVSNEAFRRFDPRHESGWRETPEDPPSPLDRDDGPALVSTRAAQAYADWLTAHAEGRRFRLPTETEWEHACRAGTRTARWWGQHADHAERYENLRGAADGFVYTAPVGRFPPNPWGLHDMLGNASEVCATPYGPYPGSPPAVVERTRDVLWRRPGAWVRRGGARFDAPRYARCAYRGIVDPEIGSNGVRLVCELPD